MCINTVPGTLLLHLLVVAAVSQKASVVTHPQPMNVSLNGFATFNCTAIASLITWEIDGVLIDGDSGLSNKGFDDTAPVVTLNSTQDLRGTSLRVLGSLNNNNTSIKCVAVIPLTLSTSDVDISEPALMLVQGLLESVSILTVTLINSTTVLISWSPPFTLEGVPILGYNVTITNTTSGESETMLVEDTTLLYSIDHPDPEINFTVTVVPINEVGAGQPAKYTTVLTLQLYRIESSSLSHITELFTTTTGSVRTSHIIVSLTSTAVITGPAHKSMMLVSTPSNGMASDSSVAVPALIAVNVITVLSILVIILTCYLLRKYKIRVPKAPLQDVVPVKDNPAYQLVILNEQPASAHSAAQQPTPAAISHQYENVLEVYKEYKGGNNEDDYENVK